MGTCASLISTLPSRMAGQASPFYWACRNGDVATVQKILPNLTYEQINRIEPNGSTALHAASFYNQPQIVKLLLETGCSRTIVNYNGATAYQEAANDEIRALFHRPASNRFMDENLTNSFNLVTNTGDNVEMKHGIPDDWFKGHTSADNAEDAKFMIGIAHTLNPLKRLIKKRTEADSIRSVNDLISKSVTPNNMEYNTVCDLHKKFINKKCFSNLLTMYSLETPLYTILQNEADSFTALIYFHLDEFADRAYQGRTYRGGTMTQSDIDAYRWALERDGYVLETRTLQSTSLNKSIAQGFAIVKGNQSGAAARHSVLLILDFPEKCPTAINLAKISNKLPALSAFEHEEEVLVLPFTLFSVKEIKIDTQNGQYRIILTNVPTPK